jgi:dTMP kinase
MRGRFIVVEGGDGSGKGGVVASLAAALTADGWRVLTTREPGGTPEGLQLRALLLAEAGAVGEQESELLLMTAARVQHVRRVIEPALAAGAVVVCDRYVGSTLAYQGGGRGLPAALILDLHRRVVGDLWPDLTVLLDVDPAVGLQRSRRRLAVEGQDEGRFEGLDLGFHARVRGAFLEQAAGAAERTVVLDAGQSVEQVQREAGAGVRRMLAGRS